MSFASDVKLELTNINDVNDCCRHAQAYGVLLTARSFSLKDISLQTDHSSVAQQYSHAIEYEIGVTPSIETSAAGKTTVKLKEKEYRAQILKCFGHTGKETVLRINRSNLADECCQAAFLRGAFISCGAVTDPEKNYHLEFSVPFNNLCRDLIALLREVGFNPKEVMRKGSHVIYFKDSESIEDMLTFIGAVQSSLQIMSVKVVKDFSNRANRRRNFDMANLSKTLDASFKLIEEIEFIERVKGKDYLPKELKDIANIKKENPEMPLSEIGQALSPPLTRSGVNHRIKKIREIYSNLSREGR